MWTANSPARSCWPTRCARTRRGPCDGCARPFEAVVSYVSSQAEYTPPVIYSQGNREKLVYRVEAAPEAAQAARLRPGLPVDVRLVEGSSVTTPAASASPR